METIMTAKEILPILGWATKTSPAGYGLVNIRCHAGQPSMLLTREEMETNARSLQFGISADQCELLAQDLISMAKQLRCEL
jgi:hypothetical protein